MFLIGFPSDAFATNCFVVARAAGEQCVVIDPGVGVLDRLASVLDQHRLKPAAVLLTHGHLDHTYSVTPVCTTGDDEALPAYIHHDDRYRLGDPVGMLEPDLLWMLQQQFGKAPTWQEPDRIVEYGDGDEVAIAGLRFRVVHAPGHTEGSAMFVVDDLPEQLPADSGLERTLFSGDVLFNGGIGRTDLAGGSDHDMIVTLRDRVLTQPDPTLVFPGHGPATTIERERLTNPYLQQLTPQTGPDDRAW